MQGSPDEKLHVSNADMAAAWDGPEGDRWTEDADRYDAASAAFDRWLFDAARITPADRLLDIGCGCGLSTRQAARAAAKGSALGLDLSSRMIARAREQSRREGVDNARFEQGDAQVFPFEQGAFDAAISRFGCMFFGDPVAAFTNVARALRPGARVTLLTWRPMAENEWVLAVRAALAAGRVLPDRPPGTPGPFGLAERGPVERILSAAGLESIELTEVNEPVRLGADADDAMAYVSRMGIARALLDGLDEAARQGALAQLRETLTARATPEGVLLRGAAWVVTARRA